MCDLDKLTEDQKVATVVHHHMCRFNHIDGCDWGYSSWDSEVIGYARERYLERAKELLEAGFSFDGVEKMMRLASGRSNDNMML